MERKLLLLGLLRRQEMHGYGLVDFIERYLAACTDLKKPTAYYLLAKMAEQGWIEEEQTQDGNRPPRRVFRLKPLGEKEYQRLLRENLAHPTEAFFPGDIGLAFLESLEPGEAVELIHIRRQGLVESLQKAQDVPEHPGSLQLVLQHRIQYLQNEIAWLDDLLHYLERSDSPAASGQDNQ